MINSKNKIIRYILFSLPVISLITLSSCKENEPITYCDSQFQYEGSPFKQGDDVILNPTYNSGEDVDGEFSSTSGLVFLDRKKGTVDIGSSVPGVYVVRKSMLNNPNCGGRIQFAEISIVPAVNSTVFNAAESLTGWNASGAAYLDSEDKKEGANSIKADVNPGIIILNHATSAPVNSKLTMNTGEFRLWLYLSDADILDTGSEVGQIELSSSGGPDNQELTWGIVAENFNFKQGWNEIILKFKDARISGEHVNLEALNFFRIYMFTKAGTGPITVGLDDLKIQESE